MCFSPSRSQRFVSPTFVLPVSLYLPLAISTLVLLPSYRRSRAAVPVSRQSKGLKLTLLPRNVHTITQKALSSQIERAG